MGDTVYPVPSEWAERAWCDDATYQEMYARSVADPDGFWTEQAKRIDWITPWTTVKNTSFEGNIPISWFTGGKLNVTANCLDRHLDTRGDQTAIIWEGDDPADSQHISYRELHHQVCRMANALKQLGARKGDRITIYLSMIPELAVAMLACARIGAIHSIVFGGFSQIPSLGAFWIAIVASSSPPTKGYAATARFPSRRTSTRRSNRVREWKRWWW